MNSLLRVGSLVAAGVIVSIGVGAGDVTAQEKPGGTEGLARELVSQLEKGHVKIVAIFDLDTADGKQIPFGKWLADRISEDVAKSGKAIETVDRERLSRFPNGNELDREAKSQLRSDTAKSLGADAYVFGTFGALADGIGVTLIADRVVGPGIRRSKWLPDTAVGKITLDDSVTSQIGAPLESLRPSDGVFMSGTAGIGVPECEHCPQARFSDEAVRRKLEGTVVLDVVISAEGKAVRLDVKQKAGAGLDEEAVKAVRKWKFKPALDPDGNPVAVHQVIETTFRFGPSVIQ